MAEKKPNARAKTNTKPELKDLDTEQLTALLDMQLKIDEERKAKAEKLIAHKFEKNLNDNSKGITRGERREFKEKTELDVRDYYEYDVDQKEQLLDFLIDKRGVEGTDDISEGELFMWVEFIVGRTINPIMFEGK